MLASLAYTLQDRMKGCISAAVQQIWEECILKMEGLCSGKDSAQELLQHL